MLGLRPFVSLAWAAPSLHEIPGGVEFQDRRRRLVLFVRSQTAGRCRTQTLSRSSMAMLETWPSTHLVGTFGQAGSTWNRGASRDALVCAALRAFGAIPAKIVTNSTVAARTSIRFIMSSGRIGQRVVARVV